MSAADIDRLAKAMPLITDNGVNEALTLGMFWDSPQMTDQAKDGYRAQVRAILAEAREPTADMVAAAMAESHECVEDGHVYDEYDSDPAKLDPAAPEILWNAMIDALLAD